MLRGEAGQALERQNRLSLGPAPEHLWPVTKISIDYCLVTAGHPDPSFRRTLGGSPIMAPGSFTVTPCLNYNLS
jgi:hypothetical protein